MYLLTGEAISSRVGSAQGLPNDRMLDLDRVPDGMCHWSARPMTSLSTTATTTKTTNAPRETRPVRTYFKTVVRSLLRILLLAYVAKIPIPAPSAPPTKRRMIGIPIHRYSYQVRAGATRTT